MAIFKLIPLFFIASIISDKPREPCIVPDESLSLMRPSSDCSISHNLIRHGGECEFTCNTVKTNLRCRNGRYFTSESGHININVFCNPNCQLPDLPKHTRTSTSCHKWNFGEQNCTIYCPFNVKLAVLKCERGKLSTEWSYDMETTGKGSPESIPSVCPNNDCYEKTPAVSGHTQKIHCFNSTTCAYNCEDGFEISSGAQIHPDGRGLISCNEGSWTSPQCERSCEALPDILNGFYVNRHCTEKETTNQKLCEFICREDFVSPDKTSLKKTDGILTHYTECDANGKWKPVPRCIESPVCKTIPDFSAFTDFKITECMLDIRKCHFFCVTGRDDRNSTTRSFHDRNVKENIQYSGIISCRKGQWEIPICLPPDVCGEMPIAPKIGFSNYECDNKDNSKKSCDYVCDLNYRAVASENERGQIDCIDGHWTLPICFNPENISIQMENNKMVLIEMLQNQSENLITAKKSIPEEEEKKTIKCPLLNTFVKGKVTSNCEIDKPLNSESSCDINCTKPFEKTNLTKVELYCRGGYWMRISQKEQNFILQKAQNLTCAMTEKKSKKGQNKITMEIGKNSSTINHSKSKQKITKNDEIDSSTDPDGNESNQWPNGFLKGMLFLNGITLLI